MGVLELIEQRRKYGRLGNLHLEMHRNKVEISKDKELEVIEGQDKLNRYLIIRNSVKLASGTKNLSDIVNDGEKQDDK